MAKDLTARQREIFEFIKNMIRTKGRPPSIREIGESFDMHSTNGVRAVLEALERKGFIKRDRYTSRGIELLKGGIRPEHPRSFSRGAADRPRGRRLSHLGRAEYRGELPA